MNKEAPLASPITEPAGPADRMISRMAGRRSSAASGRDDSQLAGHQDWKPGSGLVKRMLAYSDWWNIPTTRPRSSSRS